MYAPQAFTNRLVAITLDCGINCERRVSMDGWILLSGSSKSFGLEKAR